MAMLDARVGDELMIGSATIAFLPGKERDRFRIMHDDDDAIERVGAQSVKTLQLVRDVRAIRRLAKIPAGLISSRLAIIEGHRQDAEALAESTIDQAGRARHIRERDEWARAAAILKLLTPLPKSA